MAALRFATDHNVCAFLDDESPKSKLHRDLINHIKRSRVRNALSVKPEIVERHIRDFWGSARVVNDAIEAIVCGQQIVITEGLIRRVLQFGDVDENAPTQFSGEFIKQVFGLMGYDGNYDNSQISKACVNAKWRFLIHTYFKSMTNRKACWDKLSYDIASGIIGIISGRPYNYSRFILKGMKYNLERGVQNKFLMYPRFLQCIIDDQLLDIPRDTPRLIQIHLKSQVFSKIKSTLYRGEESDLFAHMINPNLPVDPLLLNDPQPLSPQNQTSPQNQPLPINNPSPLQNIRLPLQIIQSPPQKPQTLSQSIHSEPSTSQPNLELSSRHEHPHMHQDDDVTLDTEDLIEEDIEYSKVFLVTKYNKMVEKCNKKRATIRELRQKVAEKEDELLVQECAIMKLSKDKDNEQNTKYQAENNLIKYLNGQLDKKDELIKEKDDELKANLDEKENIIKEKDEEINRLKRFLESLDQIYKEPEGSSQNKQLMIIDESEGIDFCEAYISPEPESSQALRDCAQAMERWKLWANEDIQMVMLMNANIIDRNILHLYVVE
ncbi:hypothetical protein QVD17_10992 [Tagetes erecta]|uniref:Uncharacterized protein n=1 Tax=Tagetes erecta TaxID=13708 RepID=A0AAD8P6F4_TARER|nr:hypothetical protein QVD17_10992 [Tagetes erecta]